jgi:hypothetical protein
VEEQLDLLAAGECEPETQRAIDAHLATCAACTAQLVESRRLIGLLTLDMDTAGPRRLCERIERDNRRLSARPHILPFVRRLAAVAALLLISCGLLWFLPKPSSDVSGLQLALVIEPDSRVGRGLPDAAPGPELAMAKGENKMLDMVVPHGQMGETFRQELRIAESEGRLPPPSELPSKIDLTLKNAGHQLIFVDIGGTGSELLINVEGPGVMRVQAPGASTPSYLQPRTIRLQATDDYKLHIDRLIAGRPNRLEYIYLTEPGEYTITLSLRLHANGRPVVITSQTLHLRISVQ